MIWNTQGL